MKVGEEKMDIWVYNTSCQKCSSSERWGMG